MYDQKLVTTIVTISIVAFIVFGLIYMWMSESNIGQAISEAIRNKKSIKEKYLSRVKDHVRTYFTALTSRFAHKTKPGIPEWLVQLENTLFDGMPHKDAKLWPEKFLSAINVGADLEKVKVPFIIYTLKDSIKSMDSAIYDKKKFPEVTMVIEGSKAAVLEMIRVMQLGLDTSAARAAASSAASSAAYLASNLAHWAAYSAAAAANMAASVAGPFAISASDLARSAGYLAARSAACSVADWARLAAYSAGDSAARSAAHSAANKKYSVYLLKLLRDCK